MQSRRAFTLSGLGVSLGALVAGAGVALRGNATGKPAVTFEITKSPEEWKKILTPAQYQVLRDHGTERPFSHPYDKVYEEGTYNCAGCDLPLYSSDTKFDSKTGWPSFWKPLDNAIGTTSDRQFFMLRVEVHCRRCGGHQGHVFEDGPKPTGLRYCMNGVAMKFVPKTKTAG
jgi:peptide-methionine (R)-S-oxide reductase